jgi:uncharacterized membrane protein YuzA (DUF378 family)
MKKIIDFVCLPLVLVGAVNYGLIAVFDYDILSILQDGAFIRIAQILIGVAGVGLATGWYGKK